MFNPLPLVLVVLVGALMGGIVLRAACWCYNVFASQSKDRPAVAEPSLGRATFVALACTVVVVGVRVAVVFVGARGTEFSPEAAQTLTYLSLVPAFFVMAGMLARLLPTSFGNALGVTFTAFVIGFVLSMIPSVVIPVLAG
jgi:hypothetical protein